MKKIEIFSIKFDNLTMEEALEKIHGFVVLPYSEFIVRAQKDKEFKEILNRADFCLCESRGLYLVAKFVGKPLKSNICGVELITALNKKLKIKNLKLFLYGATANVVKRVADNFGETVIGFEHGYQEEAGVIDKINLLKPDVLLVGLGSPKQEEFIYRHLKDMPSVKLAIGVGGAFDFISGRIKRAPAPMQKAGLEWLWRFLLEPSRIKRIYTGVLWLIFLALKEKIKTRLAL